jgi:hypothetical protein
MKLGLNKVTKSVRVAAPWYRFAQISRALMLSSLSQNKKYLSAALTVSLFTNASTALGESTYDFVVSGRLTDPSGRPIEGPVALDISFFHDGDGSSSIISVRDGFEKIVLQDGIFQVRVTLSPEDYNRVLFYDRQPFLGL